MPEWLREAAPRPDQLEPHLILTHLVQLALAFVLGCVVAGVYRLTQGRSRDGTTGLTATLVLLTILISLVTLVIGDSTARAFSLVGALAIVRFRTVVEDTRDTAFVIFAVAVGMSVGAGLAQLTLLAIPFVALAAILFRPRGGGESADGPPSFTLSIRLGSGFRPDEALRGPFAKHLATFQLANLSTARQGAALDLTYRVTLRAEESAAALVTDLNSLEGVQNVELRRG